MQQIEKMFKHKDLEQQLHETKLAQVNLQIAEEKERNLSEKQRVRFIFVYTLTK